MKLWITSFFLSLLLGLSLPVQAFCFDSAGARYHLDPRLLKAMAIQESGLNPGITNTNRNKAGKALSTDYGMMQINSSHVPELIAMGVMRSKDDLLTNPCLNVQVGAWILANHLQTCGVNWRCLGSYNAGFNDSEIQERRRMQYARKIYGIYQKMLRAGV